MIAVTLAVELLLMNIIGIAIRKTGVTNKEFSNRLTSLLMKFCIPCLIFNSISNAMEFSLESLSNCLVVIVLGTVAIFLSLAIGQIFYLISKKSSLGRLTRYGLTFCHFSFMGIPVMEALFGSLGTFYYAFFLIPVRIVYYAISERLMTPPGTEGAKKSLGATVKNTLLSPQMLSLFLGLIFWVTGWQLPTALNYCVKSLSSISSPLALLLCGMVIGEHNFKQLLRFEYLKLPLLRTILMPAIFFAISRLFPLLGVEPMLVQMFVIFASFPVAALMAVYAVKYDPNPDNHLMAAGSSALSVLLSAITIPIWYMLLT